jgi:acyl-CoA synthetase (AMP-forming)/AMP-acid ligase II
MSQSNWLSLWSGLSATGDLPHRSLWGAASGVALSDLTRGSSLNREISELRARSVLIATRSQLSAGLALIELDGVARRLVLCPPGLPLEHISPILKIAEIDAVVSDLTPSEVGVPEVECFVRGGSQVSPANPERSGNLATEWILLTSGTTGLPKLVSHTLRSLTGAINVDSELGNSHVWSTFYDIRRYGGLQIFLRALLGGGSLVLSSAEESTADFLVRAGTHHVTHISGTPSHWRHALMSPSARAMAPRYVRLSGEIADQAILDSLRAFYPEADVAHAFASTEAGVAFVVRDRLAGFPASVVGEPGVEVEMKVKDGSLRVRSARTASRYLGNETLADGDGFVDTRDMVELRGNRYYFVGRRDGIINVGGLKVHPEEVEAVINRVSRVRMSLVKARKNPIMGAVVVADVVARSEADQGGASTPIEGLKNEILEECRRALAPHKVPAAIRFVQSLDVSGSGKLARLDA